MLTAGAQMLLAGLHNRSIVAFQLEEHGHLLQVCPNP
jgi:hypothetical protein